MLWQIVGLYLIVTSYGFNDRVVNLDEFFRVAGVVILVNRPRLELVGLGDLLECWCWVRSPPLPDGVAAHTRECRGGDDDLAR
jgi:hypothetical protein